MNQYKRVTLYQADAKKNKTVLVKYSNFKDSDEMDKYIMKLKEENKQRNKTIRAQNIRDNIETKLNKQVEYLNETLNVNIETYNDLSNFMLDEGATSTVIFGSSKSGKTTLMTKTIYKMFYQNDNEFISTLFSGNPQINLYKDLKNLIIADGFNERSRKYIMMHKYINSKTDNAYKFLEMFDDILDIKYSSLVNNLILSYRNSNISSVICLQYIKLLSKQNRANVNNIIIFRCNSDEAIKDIIDTFLKSFLLNLGLVTYKEQYNFYKSVTENYGFFYVVPRINRMTIHRIRY